MPEQLSPSLNTILKRTSRAFYLSLRVLPPKPRKALSLAYLIARAADTVADCPDQSAEKKAQTLYEFRKSLSTNSQKVLKLVADIHPEHLGEQELLKNLPELFRELQGASDRIAIIEVLETLVEGMLWDQKLFSDGTELQGLEPQQLERYTFLVAGCVGPFWSSICSKSQETLIHLNTKFNIETALEFGKALQWVNILRDVPEDQKEKRFYLPELSSPEFPLRFRLHSQRALQAFQTAILYPNLYPVLYFRYRLSVFLPLILGLRTLENTFSFGQPRPGHRVKVKRHEVVFWLFVGSLALTSKSMTSLLLNTLLKRASFALQNSEFYHE